MIIDSGKKIWFGDDDGKMSRIAQAAIDAGFSMRHGSLETYISPPKDKKSHTTIVGGMYFSADEETSENKCSPALKAQKETVFDCAKSEEVSEEVLLGWFERITQKETA